MAASKTEMLNVRLKPEIKQALKDLADHDRRTISNMLEVLIVDKCEQLGLTVRKIRNELD